MEQSPSWKDNRSLAGQEMSRFASRRFSTAFTRARHLSISWDRSIQSVPLSHFFNNQVYIILPPTPRSSKWSVSLSYPNQNTVCTYPLPRMGFIPRQFICFNFITRVLFGDECQSWNSSPFPVSSSLLGSNIFLSLSLYAPCVIPQYVYKPTRCTKFLWLDFIFY